MENLVDCCHCGRRNYSFNWSRSVCEFAEPKFQRLMMDCKLDRSIGAILEHGLWGDFGLKPDTKTWFKGY